MQDLVVRADAICFGTIAQRLLMSKRTTHTLPSFVSSRTFKILDLNLRNSFYTKNIIEKSLELCNVLNISYYDLPILKEIFSIEKIGILEICTWFQEKYNLKYFLFISETDYSIVYSAHNYSFIKIPIEKIENIDIKRSVFVGTFIASILTGKKIS